MKRIVEAQVGDNRLQLDAASLNRCIALLDNIPDYRVPPGNVDVAFISEVECRRLHEAFFDDPDPTDVMTFPGDPADQHAGDIAICPLVAFQRSREMGLSFVSELTLYLVHAWLHLAGLEDRDDPGRLEMRRAEAFMMDLLAREQALLACTWTP